MAKGWNSSSGAELLRVLQETNDAAALDRLLSQYLPLAHRIAEKFRDSGGCLEEITQAATAGLYRAILEYSLGPDQEMVTLAIPVIVGNIKDCLREQVGGNKGLRMVQTHRLGIDRAGAILTRRLGRPPMVAELAQYTGLSKEQVCETFELEGVDRPMVTDVAGALDAAGINFALPDDRAHEEHYLANQPGVPDGSALRPGRRRRSKAELSI